MKWDIAIRIGARDGPVPRVDSRHANPWISFRTPHPRIDSPAAPAYSPVPFYGFHSGLTENFAGGAISGNFLPLSSYLPKFMDSSERVAISKVCVMPDKERINKRRKDK